MSCNRRVDDLMARSLTGELNSLTAALLRRHLRGCPQCREEYQRRQETWTAMRRMAWDPADDDLKNRIAAALPDPYESARRVQKVEAQQMRKKMVLAAALVLLLATAVMAAQYLSGGGGGGSSSGPPGGGTTGIGGGSGGSMVMNGHRWDWSSTYQGSAKVITADGKVRSRMNPSPGDQPGCVKLTVDRNNYQFDTPGKHEVKDPKTGELYGYIQMSPPGSSEGHYSPGSHSSSGCKSTQDGCEGYDKKIGLTWQLKGSATVTVTDANGQMKGKGMSCPRNAPPAPLLDVKAQGKAYHQEGYGSYPILGRDGKLLVTIVVEPFSLPR